MRRLNMDRIDQLYNTILAFREERDWKKFHTPENLAKSIVIESAELLENFQWGDEVDKDEVCDELADILIYAFLMAEAIGVDVDDIMLRKIEKNRKRFPVSHVKGNSGKNTRVDIEE